MLFNGTFTIQNKETGKHRTFRVRTQKDTARFAPGKRIVALLNGPNNESDYQGFGFVGECSILVWFKKQGVGGKSAYDWYGEMLWELATNPSSNLHDRYTIQTEKRCLRCNRKLTHPDSLASGIGPECIKMM